VFNLNLITLDPYHRGFGESLQLRSFIMRTPICLVSGALLLLAEAGLALAQNPYSADYWNETTRRYERAYHPRYYAPPVLYYGHAPQPPEYGSKLPVGDGMRYRRIPANAADPNGPAYFGRMRDDGPAVAPNFRPGRSTYGGIRYGWW
jgi:hypothetical protein